MTSMQPRFMTMDQLARRLDVVGGTLSATCTQHVWTVVVTIGNVPVARAADADLLQAVERVVGEVEARRGRGI